MISTIKLNDNVSFRIEGSKENKYGWTGSLTPRRKEELELVNVGAIVNLHLGEDVYRAKITVKTDDRLYFEIV